VHGQIVPSDPVPFCPERPCFQALDTSRIMMEIKRNCFWYVPGGRIHNIYRLDDLKPNTLAEKMIYIHWVENPCPGSCPKRPWWSGCHTQVCIMNIYKIIFLYEGTHIDLMIKLITGNYDCYCACETCLNSAKCPKRPQAQIVICAISEHHLR